MRSVLWLTAFSAIAICGSECTEAQERPGSGYVIAGLTVSNQEGLTGEVYQTYVAAPGGTTPGWLVSAGVFIGSELSLEGEVSSTGVMSAREPSRYGETFNEERRDRFFGANLRFHMQSGLRVDVEPVLGLFVVQHEGWRQTDYLTPQQQLVIGPRTALAGSAAPGVMAGLDVRVGGRHLAVVPSFRIRYWGIGGDAGFSNTYPGGGFSRWMLSPGITGRVDF